MDTRNILTSDNNDKDISKNKIKVLGGAITRMQIDETKIAEVYFIGRYIFEQCGNKAPTFEQLNKLSRQLKINVEQIYSFYRAYLILDKQLF